MEDTKSTAREGKKHPKVPLNTPDQALAHLRALERHEREINADLAKAREQLPSTSVDAAMLRADEAEDNLFNYMEGWELGQALRHLRMVEASAVYCMPDLPGKEKLRRLWTLHHLIELVEQMHAVSTAEAPDGAWRNGARRRRRGLENLRCEAEEEVVEFLSEPDYFTQYEDLAMAERKALDGVNATMPDQALLAALVLYRGFLDRLFRLAVARGDMDRRKRA